MRAAVSGGRRQNPQHTGEEEAAGQGGDAAAHRRGEEPKTERCSAVTCKNLKSKTQKDHIVPK